MIEARSLRREWPVSREKPVVAVDNLSFRVQRGTILGLLGANGAGKTTTMRMIAGLTDPTSGQAFLAGIDVTKNPREARRHLGYLSATSGLPSKASCREVLTLFATLQHVSKPRVAVDTIIERLGIGEFEHRRIEALSTGMRQRVRIAAALVHDPAALILDEPTAGLDIIAADRLLDAILHARERGATVLFSTHVLREAEKICDRICVLDQGQLIAEGSVAELQERTGTHRFDEAFVALIN